MGFTYGNAARRLTRTETLSTMTMEQRRNSQMMGQKCVQDISELWDDFNTNASISNLEDDPTNTTKTLRRVGMLLRTMGDFLNFAYRAP